MPEVTDPALLMALNGGGNGGKMSPYEAKTRENQFSQTPQIRQTLRDLATSQGFNTKIPTGRFAATVNNGVQQFPTSWQPSDVATYQSMLGLRQALTKPIASLSNPGGAGPSAREMDAVKEQELAQSMIPGPEKERGANEYLINRAGRAALDKIAFNSFSSRWRANHGGSVYATDKAGRSAEQAFADYQRSPAYKKTVLTPYTKLLANGGRAPKEQAVATVKSDADYERLPSGSHFVGPDGKQRVKP